MKLGINRDTSSIHTVGTGQTGQALVDGRNGDTGDDGGGGPPNRPPRLSLLLLSGDAPLSASSSFEPDVDANGWVSSGN